MIEFSITEIVLFLWAAVATAFWHDAHNHRKHLSLTIAAMLHGIAQGKVRVIETETGFDFKEIKQ